MKYICNMVLLFTLGNIEEAANFFLKTYADKKIFAFHGNLGAGKTTFINALCKKLEVEGTVSSPTFSIINQYENKSGATIFHIDLYRLKDELEALNAGVEECLSGNDFAFIEWPERAPQILPDETIHVYLHAADEITRKLEVR